MQFEIRGMPPVFEHHPNVGDVVGLVDFVAQAAFLIARGGDELKQLGTQILRTTWLCGEVGHIGEFSHFRSPSRLGQHPHSDGMPGKDLPRLCGSCRDLALFRRR
ncbi:hypothetical protein D3C72_2209620 [compost metagenome]